MSDTQRYYEEYWSESGFNPRNAPLPNALELELRANIPHRSRVLDLGCGSGDKLKDWVVANELEYVGVDVSAAAVESAKKNGLKAIKIEDAGSLPFNDAEFDAVVCFEVFEHLFAPYDAAEEIWRVLKPGGVTVLSVPNVGYWRRRLEHLLGVWHPFGDSLSVQKPWRDPHIRFFTRKSLRAMLGEVGFTQVEVGSHYGALLGDIPKLKKLTGGTPDGSKPYRIIQKQLPSLLGLRLHATAKKPFAGRESK